MQYTGIYCYVKPPPTDAGFQLNLLLKPTHDGCTHEVTRAPNGKPGAVRHPDSELAIVRLTVAAYFQSILVALRASRIGRIDRKISLMSMRAEAGRPLPPTTLRRRGGTDYPHSCLLYVRSYTRTVRASRGYKETGLTVMLDCNVLENSERGLNATIWYVFLVMHHALIISTPVDRRCERSTTLCGMPIIAIECVPLSL